VARARALEPDEVADRLAPLVDAWQPGATILAVEPMQSGASSLTFLARIDGGRHSTDRVVVKVAPPGVPPVLNRDVLRQARMLAALDRAPDVRVPEVLFDDAGAPPDVPPLFTMTFVEGESFEPIVDETDAFPPAPWITGRAVEAARMLGALHRLHPGDMSLGDEPVTGLDREVERWLELFRTVDESLNQRAEECGEQLVARMPEEMGAAVLHGDYRLGNMLCRADRVEAVIDWEIWALGDPRIDVAWFLMNCHPEGQPTAIRAAPGMPDASALLREYEQVAGRQLHDLAWFDALVRFKAAATIALIVKHNRRRETPLPHLEAFAAHVPPYLSYALESVARVST
jgi:aminoglycoside phosphotransferase (APT) family kinase protein